MFGPKNSMKRLYRVFRNNNTYLEVVVSESGERAARVQLNQVWGLPNFYRGVFEAGMELTGARNPQVRLLPGGLPGLLMEVEWDS